METGEFLDFVDDLSQEPSHLLDKESTCNSDTTSSDKLKETSHSLDFDSKISKSVSSSNDAQDISNVSITKITKR